MFNSNKFWLNHKDSLFELQIPNIKALILCNIVNQGKNTYYWNENISVEDNFIDFKQIQKHKNDYSIKIKRTKNKRKNIL